MEQFKEYVSSYKLPLILTLVGGVLLIGGYYSNFSQKISKNADLPNFSKSSVVNSENLSNNIKVDVAGSVKKPGVYSLSTSSRFEDAIKAAGGLAEGFNKEYVSKKLNLSQKLADGLKIYIPFENEQYLPTQTLVDSNNTSANTTLIGVNSADQKTLESLAGVGEVTAQKIINSRPYSSLEDLLYKKVVTRTVFEKIKDQIDLN